MTNRKFLLALCLTPLAIAACSGGGGGSDDGGASLSQEACGLIGSSAKIINGTACNSSGAVLKLEMRGSDFVGNCTGTLVAPNIVLTAAHCVLEGNFDRLIPAGNISVSTGNDGTPLAFGRSVQAPFLLNDINEIAQDIDPNLDPESEEFFDTFQDSILQRGLRDVAVLELDRNLSLPTLPIITSFDAQSGEIMSIFGFGITSPDGTQATNEVYSGQMRVEQSGLDNIFSIFDTDGSDTCKGDSGGPALLVTSSGEVAVIGVTSLGFSQCQPGETSVFASTSGRAGDFLQQVAVGARFL